MQAESGDFRLWHGGSLDEVANQSPVDFVFQMLEWLPLIEVLHYAYPLNVSAQFFLNMGNRAFCFGV